MTDDRCECGQRVRCPRSGATVLGNRSGVPFHVTREVTDGMCALTVRHLEGPEGLPIRCTPETAEVSEKGLAQLHMGEE